ncbi:uncharacterized protein MELLADRAFT_72374 [Melampsora larici-populina 98AG31]|uniref:Secreted protein n=1 Tax=Melampsora larici-populina (strain 98AG31 / pathotype 3-4-7) TaxID=747676 RepID=F4RT06_MELLP|nr:uncharacterized protein MELLADRAFT_72374 [Melampsora larici-populina 98AG31]EGG04421.1 hypothetical protein MELLADRAFT_72374 [Melampsora larici-populina 98AG31]
MNSLAFLILLGTSAVRAGVTPTAPGPGQVFNEGSDCTIQWNLDTTGKWTSFSIDLKTGSNQAMQLVTNVASGLDGTKGATSHSWKCPDVTPNSAIYFYEFSQAGESTTWTTRFTIASSSGATTPPTESTQPDGKKIPWGTGSLANGATPTPSTTPSTSAANTSTTMNTTTAQNTTGYNTTANQSTANTTVSPTPSGATTSTPVVGGATTSTSAGTSSVGTSSVGTSKSGSSTPGSSGIATGSSALSNTTGGAATTSGASSLHAMASCVTLATVLSFTLSVLA